MFFKPGTFSPVLDRAKKPANLDSRKAERRERVRSNVRWPILLFRDHDTDAVESVTENLNCGGFFCFSDMAVSCGELLSCILRIPMHGVRASAPGLNLLCTVRVLRIERASLHTPLGIACRIEDYHCIRVGLQS